MQTLTQNDNRAHENGSSLPSKYYEIYKVVQIWPGQTVICLHTNSPGHIWTNLYVTHLCPMKLWVISRLLIYTD
jgi:hypothetical protein